MGVLNELMEMVADIFARIVKKTRDIVTRYTGGAAHGDQSSSGAGTRGDMVDVPKAASDESSGGDSPAATADDQRPDAPSASKAATSESASKTSSSDSAEEDAQPKAGAATRKRKPRRSTSSKPTKGS